MNCEQVNQIDMVDYHSLGFQPSAIRGNDYWYLSPLRDEKKAYLKFKEVKTSGMITDLEQEEDW